MKYLRNPVSVEALTFDEFLAYARSVQTNPFGDFTYEGHRVIYKTDDLYLIHIDKPYPRELRMFLGQMLVTYPSGIIEVRPGYQFLKDYVPEKTENLCKTST